MASEQARAFHDGSRLVGLATVATRIKNGTKAANPIGLDKRQARPYYQGVNYNPKAAGPGLLDQNFSQAWKPLRLPLRWSLHMKSMIF
jgi:hypothetical protein